MIYINDCREDGPSVLDGEVCCDICIMCVMWNEVHVSDDAG